MDQGRTRFVVAAVVALVSLIFIAQGLGVPIGGSVSVMVGDVRWSVIGLVLLALAAVYAARGARRSR
jgi:hypothetical protein